MGSLSLASLGFGLSLFCCLAIVFSCLVLRLPCNCLVSSNSQALNLESVLLPVMNQIFCSRVWQLHLTASLVLLIFPCYPSGLVTPWSCLCLVFVFVVSFASSLSLSYIFFAFVLFVTCLLSLVFGYFCLIVSLCPFSSCFF